MHLVEDMLKAIAPFVRGGRTWNHELVWQRYNECVERIMNRGDWKYLVRRMRLHTFTNCVAMPFDVEKIVAYTVDGLPGNHRGLVYDFFPGGPGDQSHNYEMADQLQSLGDGHPTFFEMPEDYVPLNLIALSDNSDDYGKLITVRGYGTSNNAIHVNGETGNTIKIGYWDNGIEGNLTNDIITDCTSTFTVNEITRVIKPETSGYVTLYAISPERQAANVSFMWSLAKYHPQETIPEYHRYKLLGANLPETYNDTDDMDPYCILMLVRLRFVKAKQIDELAQIQNMAAVKMMNLSIEHEEKYEIQQATAYEQLCMRELKLQIARNKDHEANIFFGPEYGPGGDEGNIF